LNFEKIEGRLLLSIDNITYILFIDELYYPLPFDDESRKVSIQFLFMVYYQRLPKLLLMNGD